MRTNFTFDQLTDPDLAEANDILRKCVHCGFCNATCPTYLLLGDELDGPRGRIYQMQDFFENGGTPDPHMVTHIDRCLSCNACVTTCPSGVDYMHLVDIGRKRIEETHRRPVSQKILRWAMANVLPYRRRFRAALHAAKLGRLARPLLPMNLKSMLDLAGGENATAPFGDRVGVYKAEGERRMRVALLAGCVQRDLRPGINAATVRLLTRHGCEVEVVSGVGCCGALTHHLGRERDSEMMVKSNIEAFLTAHSRDPFDGIISNASGCGTMLKDYAHVLKNDPDWRGKAAAVTKLALDVSELLQGLELKTHKDFAGKELKVAYQSACSLQHAQKVHDLPLVLLRDAGFTVEHIPEAHICCGSAGTYNVMQPELAKQLKARKAHNIKSLSPDVVASGNIGCIMQLDQALKMPIVHTVELLDWATGGPAPHGLRA